MTPDPELTPPPKTSSLADAGLSLSAIGFGCASLMRLPSARERRELIAATIDAGITHFDVARMYGLGAAEAELGRALRGRPESVTIATKFGIDASGALQRLGRLQAPARALLARSSKLRSTVQARRDSFATPRRYDADKARISLDRSLQELGVGHVDILFLHDPRRHDEIEQAALVEFLDAARRDGKIRAWGSSLDSVSDFEQMTNLPPAGVLQTRVDLLQQEPPPGTSLVFGLMARHSLMSAWLRSHSDRRAEWSAALGADPLVDDLLAKLLLAQAMALPGTPVALYATTKTARLEVAATVLSAPPGPALTEALSGLMAADRDAILGAAQASGRFAP
ncbi:MAG TPA: aldo/keto reductase [Solirubrobacteraceae bacterium]|jgi:aryl-alcohol dehydrogenase-like predicted oxidoreductase|nr:aldo/keto reductase [Solirubrobacteraceae bacterium]